MSHTFTFTSRRPELLRGFISAVHPIIEQKNLSRIISRLRNTAGDSSSGERGAFSVKDMRTYSCAGAGFPAATEDVLVLKKMLVLLS